MKKGQLEIDEQQNKMQVVLSILPFKKHKILAQIFLVIFIVFSISLKEQVRALKLEILSYDVAWVEIAKESIPPSRGSILAGQK